MKLALGFAEECDPKVLKSCYLPVMKIGGKPAWLDLKNIPTAEEVACGVCKDPCVFLCQIYATDDQNDQAYHRSLFVFVCRKGQCWKPNSNDNLKVFRSQLPLDNDFYDGRPLDPDRDEGPEKSEASFWTKVCKVCSIKAPSRCKKCQKANYCSRKHQVVDWKAGHGKACAKLADLGLKEVENGKAENHEEEEEEEKYEGFLFPEYEIENEEESDISDSDDDDDDDDDEDDEDEDGKKEKEEIEKFKKMLMERRAGTLQHIPDKDFENIFNQNNDKACKTFLKTVRRAPAQVIRYQRRGDPLYVSDENKPLQIPVCENCKSSRTFEFQIMPHLLIKLKDQNIDWGTLLVFTCEKSCSISGYQQEFIWKQDFV